MFEDTLRLLTWDWLRRLSLLPWNTSEALRNIFQSSIKLIFICFLSCPFLSASLKAGWLQHETDGALQLKSVFRLSSSTKKYHYQFIFVLSRSRNNFKCKKESYMKGTLNFLLYQTFGIKNEYINYYIIHKNLLSGSWFRICLDFSCFLMISVSFASRLIPVLNNPLWLRCLFCRDFYIVFFS